MVKILGLLVFLSGCSFGVGPKYTKINSNGAFLLTQSLNEDILCVNAEEQPREIKKVRCYYVSDGYKQERWQSTSSSGSL